MSNCIFCKIINKEIPSKIIYEDTDIIAFNDINPEAPIHVLIVPKRHIESLIEVEQSNANVIVNIHMAVNKIARELGVDKSGFRLITNCGKDALQSVMHLHYHLLAGKNLGAKIVNN